MFKNYNLEFNSKIKENEEYYNINKILYNSDKKPCDFIIGKKIGAGRNGEIFSACCDTDCNFVLKKVSFKKISGKIPITIEQFQKEIRNQSEASKYYLAPKIVFSYLLEESQEAGFIMERLDETLLDYLLNEKNTLDNKMDYLEKAVDTLKGLHEVGISHGDIKLENFMIYEDDVMLIDFGYSNSKENTSRIQNKFKDDFEELLENFSEEEFGDKIDGFSELRNLLEDLLD